MGLSILGLGTVSALGCGIDSLQAGLEGLAQPAIEMQSVMTPQGPATLPVYTARSEGLDRFIPKRSLRRLDNFVRMALLSSFLAVEDAGLELEDRARVGIIFGTGYGPLRETFGFQDGMIDFGDKCASPTHFANSVHNALASQVSIALRIEGPCQTITCFERTVAAVMLTARLWLEEGMADYVLAGVGDEYCPVSGYAIAGFGASGEREICPFVFDRCTYLPGEGFAAFLLAPDSRDKGKYGQLHETRMIFDPPTDPAALKDLLGPHHAVFLAANGRRRTGLRYHNLRIPDKKYAAYASLYGGLPIGIGFELASAALSLKNGMLYASPAPEGAADWNVVKKNEPLPRGSSLACVECLNDQEYVLFSLSQ